MNNRFMLAPMTNKQSHQDGTLSDEELHWLEMRARGGFGGVMTCATNVQKSGKTWEGELGSYSDQHVHGLARFARAAHQHDSLALVQIFHGGLRSSAEINGGFQPVAPSPYPGESARELSIGEIKELVLDFAAAARRCLNAGCDGVEIHGAHGYLICQFLSPEYNKRTDAYGGNYDNRIRFLLEILRAVRGECGPDFIVGLRLSPEGNGLLFDEMLRLAGDLLQSRAVDFLDVSLWDCFKHPEDPAYAGNTLLQWYSELPRGGIPLGVAGKLFSAKHVESVLREGADFVLLGRAAIIHHDFPRLAIGDSDFAADSLPVSRAHLASEGLSPRFIDYMSRWDGFVSKE